MLKGAERCRLPSCCWQMIFRCGGCSCRSSLEIAFCEHLVQWPTVLTTIAAKSLSMTQDGQCKDALKLEMRLETCW